MNVSIQWLRDYVPQAPEPDEVGRILTRIGLNVEEITPAAGGDVCLNVEVTSNRPDCLGHVGIARELAAALGAEPALPDASYEEADEEACEDLTSVEVAEPDLCPIYTARVIRGVEVGPSPQWLAARLEAVGVRPVNNIVDVTNYVMFETGHPLHAFDLARLQERRIVVRRAHDGERFTAIDHSEHFLTPDRLVIADGRRAVALAGVMGGVDTEIGPSTADVLLEAASFDSLSIRTTARALALASESSYRFERGVDPGGVDGASRRACRLILETAGGRAAPGACTGGKPLPGPRELTLRVGRVETIMGLAVPPDECAALLEPLGLELLERTDETLRVRVPSWRGDLEREVDLVEEVARHHGYDVFGETERFCISYAGPSRAERVRQGVSEVLTGAGYFEAITFTFTPPEKATRFSPRGPEAEALPVRGAPLVLRQSVLPGLLDSVRTNRSAGGTARLFEIARRFLPAADQALPEEHTMLALVSPDGFAAVKGVVETALGRLGLGGRVRFAPGEGRADLDAEPQARVLLDGEPLGVVGRATGEAAEVFGLEAPPTVAELVYDRLVEAAELEPAFRPLPQYPAITRDLALVVDEDVRWEEVVEAVEAAGIPELEALRPVDVYRGQQVPAGRKSLAVRLVLRSPDRTLTHEAADRMQAKVLAALKQALGATLRQ